MYSILPRDRQGEKKSSRLDDGAESNTRKTNTNEASGRGGRVLAACNVLLALLVDKVVDTDANDAD